MNAPVKEGITIPVLPCTAIVETLDFWASLGFSITYKQLSPYQYGIVEKGGYQLHFVKTKGIDHTNNTNTCLMMVSNVLVTHQHFKNCMREKLGKVPVSGLPRISRMRPGQTRFTLTDVSGNSVIVIQYGEKDQDTYEKANDPNLTPLQKFIAVALRLRDYKEDFAAAAKTLDGALKRTENESAKDIAEALIMRVELARAAEDQAKVEQCNALLGGLTLPSSEMTALQLKHHIIS